MPFPTLAAARHLLLTPFSRSSVLVETHSPPPTTFRSTSPMPFPSPVAAHHSPPQPPHAISSTPPSHAPPCSQRPSLCRPPPFDLPRHPSGRSTSTTSSCTLAPASPPSSFATTPWRTRGGLGPSWDSRGKASSSEKGREASSSRPSPEHERQFTADPTWCLGMAATEQLKDLGEKLDVALVDPTDALTKLLENAYME